MSKFRLLFLGLIIMPVLQAFSQEQNHPVMINVRGEQLMVFPADNSPGIVWGPRTLKRTYAHDMDDGQKNTLDIVKAYGNQNNSEYAANICHQLDAYGYTDWYLPSVNEIRLVYQQKETIGGFMQGRYWTSTDNQWSAGNPFILDFSNGVRNSLNSGSHAGVRCVRRPEIPVEPVMSAGPVHKSGDFISVAFFRINEQGTSGLLFASKMIGFFSAAAFNESAVAIAADLLKTEAKSLGIRKLLETSPGADREPAFISILFPLAAQKEAILIDDLVFLKGYHRNELPPLGVPLTLHYMPQNPGEEGPILAKPGFFKKKDLDESSQKYLTVSEAGMASRVLQSPERTFQTMGVAGMYTQYQGETMMIMKEYAHYDVGFSSGTSPGFIAIRIPADMEKLPAPGSVVHIYGSTRNLSGLGMAPRLWIDHTPWYRPKVAKYVETEKMTLLGGKNIRKEHIAFDQSIFSLYSDHTVYQSVVVDLSATYADASDKKTNEKDRYFSGTFSFEMKNNEKQTISREIEGHLIELQIDPVNNLHFNLFFNGVYYDLYDAPRGPGRNSLIWWEEGKTIEIPGNSSVLEIPVLLTIRVISETAEGKHVEIKVRKNRHYGYYYDITEFLGHYFCRYGSKYNFYRQGKDLYLQVENESPYLKSGKLEKTGYRTYKRSTYSGMGIVTTGFTFNKSPNNKYDWGHKKVNVIPGLVDYPSQGFLLYKVN